MKKPYRDSKIWEKAYKAYRRQKSQPKNKQGSGAQTWIEKRRDFLRWKKTEDYAKWRKNQFAKQDAQCYYCDISLIGTKTNIEHITPLSRGGTNSKKNLVLACWQCNKDKGSTPLERSKKSQLRNKHAAKQIIYEAELDMAVELFEQFRE